MSRRRNDETRSNGRLITEESSTECQTTSDSQRASETSSGIREGKEDRTTSMKTTTAFSINVIEHNSQRKENMPERINDEKGSMERQINEVLSANKKTRFTMQQENKETSNYIRRLLEEGRKKCATSIETTTPKSNTREAQNSQQKEEKSSDKTYGMAKGRENLAASTPKTPPNANIRAAQNSQQKEGKSSDKPYDMAKGRENTAASTPKTPSNANIRAAQNSQQKEGKSSATKNDMDNGQENPATSKPKTSSSTSGKDNTQRDMTEEPSDRTSKILFEAKESLEKGPGKGKKYKHRLRPGIPKITSTHPEIAASILKIISGALAAKDIWTKKDPSTSAGILPEDFGKMIRTMIPIAKSILGSVPRYRLYHLGLDLLNVSLTKKLGQEWIAGGVTALKDFLKTSPSLESKAIGACLGFVLTGMTTDSGLKLLIDGADAATYIAKLLPQTSRLVPFLSFGKEILESMEGKEGLNRILSVSSVVLRRFPPTKLIGAALDFGRTVMYDLPGKGFIDGALCLGDCVLRNIDVVPGISPACKAVGSLVCSGAKWVASWFGW